MQGFRQDSPAGGPRYRISYSRPSTMDDGKPCRVYCHESEADKATVELVGMQYREWEFARAKHDESRWDSALENLLRAFEIAFEQGVNHQKVVIRDTLREVIGV